MRSRVIFGFLRKRSKGAIKFFNNRWWFLISSRPLNTEDFIRDSVVLGETVLPPLFEFDTIYQYFMDAPEDASGQNGTIKTNDLISITIKDMSKSSSEDGHAFILDSGNHKYHLNSLYRFEMERWVEAIVISMQTARESKMSLTGACKNISMLVSQFDMDKKRLEIKIRRDLLKRLPLELEEWDGDIDVVLEQCSHISEELIETFDACLAIKPQRKDIITFLMDISHVHLLQLLSCFWEKYGIDLNPFVTLTLIDYAYQYHNKLRKFGVREDFLYNGFITLCNAYSRKIHS